MAENGRQDCAGPARAEKGSGHGPAAGSAGPLSLGVIITNRDRTPPLPACLGSLAVQDLPPAWVLLCDFGSQPQHRAELAALADRNAVSYLRIDHDGAWNKSLAFNTAFRLARRALPAVTHVIQLDVDTILHPHLLSRTAAMLRDASSCYCAPRLAPPGLAVQADLGDTAGYERMLAQCGPINKFSVGAFMVLPCDWLDRQRGFDEAFAGWGHEDTDLWLRVQSSLRNSRDISGTMLIHQWHPQQPGVGQRGANWKHLVNRMANPGYIANPADWGTGRIAESVLRPGLISTP